MREQGVFYKVRRG